MHAFASAMETQDFELLETMLVEDITFHSPITDTYQGRQMAMKILTGATNLLEDLHYTDEIAQENTLILRFRARVGKKEFEGCHFLNTNEKGQIQEINTMMRPLDAVIAFYEGMEAYRLRQLRENTQ